MIAAVLLVLCLVGALSGLASWATRKMGWGDHDDYDEG